MWTSGKKLVRKMVPTSGLKKKKTSTNTYMKK